MCPDSVTIHYYINQDKFCCSSEGRQDAKGFSVARVYDQVGLELKWRFRIYRLAMKSLNKWPNAYAFGAKAMAAGTLGITKQNRGRDVDADCHMKLKPGHDMVMGIIGLVNAVTRP